MRNMSDMRMLQCS